jgi:hypothetical protein
MHQSSQISATHNRQQPRNVTESRTTVGHVALRPSLRFLSTYVEVHDRHTISTKSPLYPTHNYTTTTSDIHTPLSSPIPHSHSLSRSWPRTTNSITASPPSPPSSPISETLASLVGSLHRFPGKWGFSLSGKSSEAEGECTPFVVSVKPGQKSKGFRFRRRRMSGLRSISISVSFLLVSHSKRIQAPL